ncbi:DUF308 domain-containing protein [Nitratireductor aquimarinus]|nr:DUF308 domain-containing protein [Nitratireductor pacificus]MBN7790274.1 DUF308 domain-containing protein [Nitratireductor aquimarinus]MCV0348999.1 DUF308 domain-containing protein [Nitratireductor sp.]MBN7781468.1 DUF308 domain-containing protein [Nitratireductor pacificus]MBN8242172.1 DUF308 domain-containing protein [Nitratireductor aquimarinus]
MAALGGLKESKMKNWFWWLLAGIISLVGGFIALANPLAATLTAELLAGWVFIVVGILTILSVFNDQGWGGRLLSILLGLALLFVGVSLIANPLGGMVSLTFVVAAMLLAMGVMRIFLGIGASDSRLRWIMILAGIVSLVLGGMILANFPQSALVVLGIFLAVELISNGVSLIVLALSRKSPAA